MNPNTTTPFPMPSAAAALMRVGFGSWTTGVMVVQGLAQVPLQWSRVIGV